MRKEVIVALMAVVVLAGCSKKAAPIAEQSSTTTEPQSGNGDTSMVSASIEDISKKVEAQQYDAAVGAITAMNRLPMSPLQQAEYMRQVRLTQQALAARAAQGDVAAQQSQMMLGRMMTGR